MDDWIIFDFDGTLSTARSGWTVLAALFGTEEKSMARKRRYFSGEISFRERIDQDITEWQQQAVTRDDVKAVANAIKLSLGAESVLSTISNSDYRFGVLSAGVVDLMTKIQPFDPAFVLGNELIFENDQLTGASLRVSATDKTDRLASLGDRFGFDPSQIVYVGDSNTDIEAFEVVDKALLFNPDSALEKRGFCAADTIIESRDLTTIFDHLSISQ